MTLCRRTIMGIAAATGVVACGLLVPLDRDPSKAAANGVDAGDGQVAADACGPVPDPPSPRSAPDMPAYITFIGTKWAFKPVADEEGFCDGTPSLNLDHLDTRSPEPDSGSDAGPCEVDRSCRAHPSSGTVTLNACDGPGGADIGFQTLYEKVSALPQVGRPVDGGSFDLSHLIMAGFANSIVYLASYSGEADDESVNVGFFQGAAVEGHEYGFDGGVFNLAQVERLPIVWDAGPEAGAWFIDERTVDEGVQYTFPKYGAPGYVRDYVLVVPDTKGGLFPIGSAGEGTYYSSGIFMGKLEPPTTEGTGWRLTHARLSVRVPSSEMLRAAGSVSGIFASDGQFCEGSNADFYASAVRPVACAAQDLPLNEADNDPNRECNAISVGVHVSYIEGSVVTTPDGKYVTRHSNAVTDFCRDGGFEWCDDCAWDAASRCPIDRDR